MSSNDHTRRRFCSNVAFGAMAGALSPTFAGSENEYAADVVIIGSGLGGCAAAMGALRNGLKVVMTETTDWIGGQLTSQGVPPDEHHLIETTSANQSYRELRSRIREHYRKYYPLTDTAGKDPRLNPGNGNVIVCGATCFTGGSGRMAGAVRRIRAARTAARIRRHNSGCGSRSGSRCQRSLEKNRRHTCAAR